MHKIQLHLDGYQTLTQGDSAKIEVHLYGYRTLNQEDSANSVRWDPTIGFRLPPYGPSYPQECGLAPETHTPGNNSIS